MPRASKTVAAASKQAGAPTRSKGGTARSGASGKPAPKPTPKPAPKAATKSAAKKVSSTRSTSRPSPAPARTATKRSSRKAAEPEAPVVDKFLQEQRALLLAERATYLEQAESLRAEAEQLAADMEPGDIQFDEESGEGGTLNIERERDLALSAQARAAVEEIDRALSKIESGSYGVCELCGEPIKRARLKALPYASLCIACKSGGLSRR
jgi:DnaK suppressor protein